MTIENKIFKIFVGIESKILFDNFIFVLFLEMFIQYLLSSWIMVASLNNMSKGQWIYNYPVADHILIIL